MHLFLERYFIMTLQSNFLCKRDGITDRWTIQTLDAQMRTFQAATVGIKSEQNFSKQYNFIKFNN